MNEAEPDLFSFLQDTFGEALVNAAERLIASGRVVNVRAVQAGSVVTGIVSADPQTGTHAPSHRVYIQYRKGQGAPGVRSLKGECSCGERHPCVHIAAVSIAAAKGAQPAPTEPSRASSLPSAQRSSPSSTPSREPVREPTTRSPRDRPVEQQLFYLLEAPGGPAPLRLSIWVGRKLAGGSRVDESSICSFAPRRADGAEGYPRYVQADDRAILTAVTAQHRSAPWELRDAAGAELLQQCISTGRAFWLSLKNNPLRFDRPRNVRFEWEAQSNGDQALRPQAPESVHVSLTLEPPLYVDSAVDECGIAQLPCSVSLLRQLENRSPIAPEQVAAVNEDIERNDAAGTFPRLRALTLQRQARSSLQAKLLLRAGPEAMLSFLYNGLAVDAHSLHPNQQTVRQLREQTSTVIYEIDRDPAAERQLQAQWNQALPAEARENPAAWLAFMIDTAPGLRASGWTIDVAPGFPYQIATPDQWYANLQTDVLQPPRTGSRARDQQRDWFDLRLGVMVDGHAVNLLPALVSYLQGESTDREQISYRVGDRLLIRLGDGRYAPVPLDRIQCIADTLIELFDRETGLNDGQALSLPTNQAGRLAQLALDLNSAELQSNAPSMLALVEELKGFSGIQPLHAPEHFRASLRPYQQEGLGWLQFLRRCHLGGILADDMGLGKTVQTLAHLVLEKQEGRLTAPSLIVAPVSVIGNWQQEIQRFAPELKLLTLYGPKRRELFPAIPAADIVVIGYPSLQLDSEALLACAFYFLILDEAQTIKNPRANVSQMARALRAEHRLCLTGTPMENHLGELWSLFDFLQPGFLGDERQFQRQYRAPIEKGADSARSAALARRLAPFILRRTKDAVAKDLPEKTQIVESIVLDERQRGFYDGIRLAMHRRVREVIDQQGLARSHITVLDALLKLRQACCDPQLVDDDAQTRSIPSAKMDWLRTVLPELVAEGRRILLFSQFTSMLRLIEALVKELELPYLLLTGETRERSDLVARFQALEAPLFLISLKAGGTGLNLTAADTVIHYDPWWNPAAEAQATDRAHRIGQDKPVFVYKLIAQGTVEEKIMQLQADKHALAAQLFTEHNASPARLTATDLESLFLP